MPAAKATESPTVGRISKTMTRLTIVLTTVLTRLSAELLADFADLLFILNPHKFKQLSGLYQT